jgi:uncharacterized damage-inducible protein DinB
MDALPVRSGRPGPGEYADYAEEDISLVQGEDAVEALQALRPATHALMAEFGEAGADHAYAEGKWTVRQILGHLADDERIFGFRILAIARGDAGPHPGFDENAYMAAAAFHQSDLEALLADYDAVRSATLTLLQGLDRTAWLRRGVVNGYTATPRGLAFHIAGHELHHHRVLRQRYLL